MIYDLDGKAVGKTAIRQTYELLVASSDAEDDIKANADYVCTGTNDELVLQQAINAIANHGGGVLRLSKGTFYIDSFPQTDTAGDYCALMLPIVGFYSISILGAPCYTYGWSKDAELTEGTIIDVTENCYNSLSANTKYTILRSAYASSLMASSLKRHELNLDAVNFRIPSNQKQIVCLDCRFTNKILLTRLAFRAFKPGFDGYSSGVPQVAGEGCIGFRSMMGSNAGQIADIRNCIAQGFYEGFALGGEHLICMNLSTQYCVYGYTFGNYTYTEKCGHPITLINCCDERNVNYPLFVNSGNMEASSRIGKQQMSIIDFNMERAGASTVPGGVEGNKATETYPGAFCGSINYTISTHHVNPNSTNVKFWADGSGHGFTSRNDAQELSGTSTVRRAYAPNFMQAFYDTTVGKMLWCIDTATPTWVDAQGNTVA